MRTAALFVLSVVAAIGASIATIRCVESRPSSGALTRQLWEERELAQAGWQRVDEHQVDELVHRQSRPRQGRWIRSAAEMILADPVGGGGLQGAYVKKSGDTMFGALKFSGPTTSPDIVMQPSGYNLSGNNLPCGNAQAGLCVVNESTSFSIYAGATRYFNVNPGVQILTPLIINTSKDGSAALRTSGTGWVEIYGDTQANVQASVPSAGKGAVQWETTSSRLRGYEGTNWNFIVTVNADGGTPLIKPVPAQASQVDGNNGAVGFSIASDRSPNGAMAMFGDGTRATQLGGGMHWGLQTRTLAINTFLAEGTYCPRCLECRSSTLTAFDGQTCTDAAASSTTTVDTVDMRNFNTAASAASVSSWTSRTNETQRNKFPHMVWVGYVGSTTSIRAWYGLSSAALNGSATPAGDYAAFRFDTSASDTTWKACTRDNSTTSCTDTGVTVSASQAYILEVDCRDSGTAACVFTVQNKYTGVPVTIRKTTNLPTLATAMSPRMYCEALAASARTCGIGPSSLETR